MDAIGEGRIFEIRGAVEAIAGERLKIIYTWLQEQVWREKSVESKKRRTNSEEMMEHVGRAKYNIASELVRVEERKIIWVLVSAW